MNEDFEYTINNQLIWCNKFIKLNPKVLLFSSWVKEGILMLGKLNLDSAKLDIKYLESIVKDKRQFYEANILQKALNRAKINISSERTKDTKH